MAMLFFSFLNIQIKLASITSKHFQIVLLNLLLPLICFYLLKGIHPTSAAIVFILMIVPTGVASTVIAEIMKRKVETVTFSVVLTSIIITLLLPFILPFILNTGQEISTKNLLAPILSLIFIPLISSQLLKQYFSVFTKQLLRLQFLTFPLFLLNIFVACGNASHFIQNNEAIGFQQLCSIFLLAGVVCILHFQIGAFIGQKDQAIEFSLGLGRKNTMIGLWLALTYFDPLVALGPICYIVAHNIYNSYQIWQLDS